MFREDQVSCNHQELLSSGWQRRFVTDKKRAQELEKVYRDTGFEVRIEWVTPERLDKQCSSCAESVCKTYAIIYTRKQ